MKPRHKRLIAIGAGVAALGVAAALVLSAFQQNLVFFFTPSQIAANEAPQGRTFRIGGMVEKGSVKREGVEVRFVVTDTAKTIPVVYSGEVRENVRRNIDILAPGGGFVFQQVHNVMADVPPANVVAMLDAVNS